MVEFQNFLFWGWYHTFYFRVLLVLRGFLRLVRHGFEENSSSDEEDVAPKCKKAQQHDQDPEQAAEAEPERELTGSGQQCFDLLKQIQASQTEADPDWESGRVSNFESLRLGAATRSAAEGLDLDDLKACVVDDPTEEHEERQARFGQFKIFNSVFVFLVQGTLYFSICSPVCQAKRPRLEHEHQCVCLSDLFNKGAFADDAVDAQKDAFAYLHALVVNLRVGNGYGCDARFIKNHKNCRSIAGKRNWHQILEHIRKRMNDRSGLSAHRVSRTEAWKTVASSMAQKILSMPSDLVPNTLSCGTVVLVLSTTKPQTWHVGVVFSIWYMCGKKHKPTHLPTSVERIRTVRVCLLRPKKGYDEGCFFGDARSIAMTCSPVRIAVTLPCETIEPSPESFVVTLTDDALQAVQNAHKISWPKGLCQDDAVPCSTFPMSPPKKASKTSTGIAGSPKKDVKQGKRAKDAAGLTEPAEGHPEKKSKLKHHKDEKDLAKGMVVKRGDLKEPEKEIEASRSF